MYRSWYWGGGRKENKVYRRTPTRGRTWQTRNACPDTWSRNFILDSCGTKIGFSSVEMHSGMQALLAIKEVQCYKRKQTLQTPLTPHQIFELRTTPLNSFICFKLHEMAPFLCSVVKCSGLHAECRGTSGSMSCIKGLQQDSSDMALILGSIGRKSRFWTSYRVLIWLQDCSYAAYGFILTVKYCLMQSLLWDGALWAQRLQ